MATSSKSRMLQPAAILLPIIGVSGQYQMQQLASDHSNLLLRDPDAKYIKCPTLIYTKSMSWPELLADVPKPPTFADVMAGDPAIVTNVPDSLGPLANYAQYPVTAYSKTQTTDSTLAEMTTIKSWVELWGACTRGDEVFEVTIPTDYNFTANNFRPQNFANGLNVPDGGAEYFNSPVDYGGKTIVGVTCGTGDNIEIPLSAVDISNLHWAFSDAGIENVDGSLPEIPTTLTAMPGASEHPLKNLQGSYINAVILANNTVIEDNLVSLMDTLRQANEAATVRLNNHKNIPTGAELWDVVNFVNGVGPWVVTTNPTKECTITLQKTEHDNVNLCSFIRVGSEDDTEQTYSIDDAGKTYEGCQALTVLGYRCAEWGLEREMWVDGTKEWYGNQQQWNEEKVYVTVPIPAANSWDAVKDSFFDHMNLVTNEFTPRVSAVPMQQFQDLELENKVVISVNGMNVSTILEMQGNWLTAESQVQLVVKNFAESDFLTLPPRFNNYHNFCRNPEGNADLWCKLVEEDAILAGQTMDFCQPITDPNSDRNQFCLDTLTTNKMSQQNEWQKHMSDFCKDGIGYHDMTQSRGMMINNVLTKVSYLNSNTTDKRANATSPGEVPQWENPTWDTSTFVFYDTATGEDLVFSLRDYPDEWRYVCNNLYTFSHLGSNVSCSWTSCNMHCKEFDDLVYQMVDDWTCQIYYDDSGTKKGYWNGTGCQAFAFVAEPEDSDQDLGYDAAAVSADGGGSSGLSVNSGKSELPVALIVILSVIFLALVSCGTVYWVFIRHMRAVTRQLKHESKKKKQAFKSAKASGKTRSVNLEDILASMDIDDEDIDYETMEQDTEMHIDYRVEGKKILAEESERKKLEKGHKKRIKMTFQDQQKYGLHGVQKEWIDSKGAPTRSIV